jgi:hypothetical protein
MLMFKIYFYKQIFTHQSLEMVTSELGVRGDGQEVPEVLARVQQGHHLEVDVIKPFRAKLYG